MIAALSEQPHLAARVGGSQPLSARLAVAPYLEHTSLSPLPPFTRQSAQCCEAISGAHICYSFLPPNKLMAVWIWALPCGHSGPTVFLCIHRDKQRALKVFLGAWVDVASVNVC